MSDCIEWTGSCDTGGYGKRQINGVTVYAHRLAWQEANGPIPDGLCVLHRCDNRPCINVDHLFLGTVADNNRDRDAKGRRRSLYGAENPAAKLTQSQVDEIRQRYAAGGVTKVALGVEFGVDRSNIGHIIAGRAWRALTTKRQADRVSDATVPLDAVHEACVAALHVVRARFGAARLRVAVWEPAPTPPQKAAQQ